MSTSTPTENAVEAATTEAEAEGAAPDCWSGLRSRRSRASLQERNSRHRSSQRLADLVHAGAAGAVFEGDSGDLFAGSSDADSAGDAEPSVRVVRPVSTQQQFDERHGGRLVRRSLLQRLRNGVRSAVARPPDKRRVKAAVFHVLPFLDILRKYKVKEWLLSDFISGITVGIMHIPQGMAYALLAGLPPYIGLYASFFPSLVYFFFGTSRQVSIGTVAIVALLTGGLMQKNFPMPQAASNSYNGTATTATMTTTENPLLSNASDPGDWQLRFWGNDPLTTNRVTLACVASLSVGLIQLAMGILHLGFLTRYLSDPLISGFTMGVAVQVFSSQLKTVLGITVPNRDGLFGVPLLYVDLIRNITKTNIVTLIISVIAMIILFVTKEYINPLLRKKIKAPLPTELLILILGTVLSYVLDLKTNYKVNIVGPIPNGIPPPQLPDFRILTASMAGDIITLAVISYSVNVSLAKIFGRRYNYEVSPTQELVAIGMCNSVGSFFHCFPTGASLSRSAVQDSMGGRTQVASLFSGSLVLMVLLFLGKYFETVPNCCLSAIIIIAVRGMLEQVKEAPMLWRLSSYDFWTWMVTCLGVVFIQVDYGLLMGLAFSVCTIIVRTQSPTSSILGRITGTDLYKNLKAYDDIQELRGIKIFRYEGSLYYACAENFCERLYRKSGANPRKLSQQRKRVFDKFSEQARSQENADLVLSAFAKLSDTAKAAAVRLVGLEWPRPAISHVILDASTWGYIDFVGVRTLNQVIQEYREIGVSVYVANPKCGIRAALSRSDFYEKNEYDIIYVTVHDAVLASQFDQKSESRVFEDPSNGVAVVSVPSNTTAM